ncbi:TonB-dependent siderophore receptor [Pasteurellaceae bacterium 15-036681]|nr:TonB-dependent siderophore receptor [Pasteurellaceae bacterium 15-036681]
MKQFNLLPISAAVLSALCSGTALAENNDTVVLDTVHVTDNQGLKVKSNIVTTQKKDESIETDLRGLFKNEPAIGIGGGNGTSQYLYLRGMGQNSVDVKIDNAYSDSQIHYHQGRHMLDPALVKVVSVQKGAGSASAGIGQTNGAIVAKTVDADDLLKNSGNKNFGVKANGGYNSNDGYNYGLSTFGKNDTFDFVAAVNGVNEDDYKGGKNYTNAKDGSSRVPYSALDKLSYLFKVGANIENHRFVLSHMKDQYKGDRTVREEFTVDNSPGSRLTADRQAPSERKMTVTNTNLEWTGKELGFAKEATANIYQLVHGRWSADDSGNGYAGGKANTGSTKTKVETVGANINFDSELHENLLLKYGVNYRQQEIKPAKILRAGVVNQEKRDVGVYTEAITSIRDVILTAGARYDHFQFKAMDGKKVSDGAVNPSLGLIYEPVQGLALSVSHNHATRSPRMHDALMSHGARGVVSIADGTKAEKARNTEIGFNYDNGIWGVEGSYFWQNIKDALGTTTGRNNHLCSGNNQQCASEIINAGKIKNHGYELATFFNYNNFFARLGVAYSKPRFYGEKLSANPEYAAAIGRTWTGTLGYRFEQPNVELAVHHRQVEGVDAEDNFFLSNSTVQAAKNGKSGYGVTDITANWKPLGSDKMNVNFAINNIGNKNYVPHSQRSNLPGTGREYRVAVNYTF